MLDVLCSWWSVGRDFSRVRGRVPRSARRRVNSRVSPVANSHWLGGKYHVLIDSLLQRLVLASTTPSSTAPGSKPSASKPIQSSARTHHRADTIVNHCYCPSDWMKSNNSTLSNTTTHCLLARLPRLFENPLPQSRFPFLSELASSFLPLIALLITEVCPVSSQPAPSIGIPRS